MTAVNERHERRKVLLAQACDMTGLAADDLRAETLSWALLALDGEKERLLHGHAVTLAPWQALVDQFTALCPKPTTLVVKYVYTCQACLKETADDPEPHLHTAADAKAAAQTAAAAAHASNSAPVDPVAADPADAQAAALGAAQSRTGNVTPLHKPKPEPKRPDTYVAPAVDITGGARDRAALLKGESLGELVAALNNPTPKPY